MRSVCGCFAKFYRRNNFTSSYLWTIPLINKRFSVLTHFITGLEKLKIKTMEKITLLNPVIQTSIDKEQDDKLVNQGVFEELKISKRAMKRLKRREKQMEQEQPNNEIELAFFKEKEKKLKEVIKNQILFDMINDEALNETEYYIENGLRKVRPYFFNYTSFAKGRWLGKTLVDVFTKEFRDYDEEKCKRLIREQMLTIVDKKIDCDYIIQNGDVISNKVHRHELPVRSVPITIVAETEDILVVDKPSSIPIHPCGRYRHNTLLFILAKEYGYKNLRVMHRLDRLTSGIVLLGKSEQKTSEIMESMRNREVKKEYLAKVEGIFPSESIECNEPLDTLSHKLGVHKVSPNGKDSSTTFNLISTDGKTSIVRCKPKTGRTHQIRVHLQYLGFPITNDPIYNDYVWGPEKGKNALYNKSEEQLINDIAERHKASLYIYSEPQYPSDVLSQEEPPTKIRKLDLGEDSIPIQEEVKGSELNETPNNCKECPAINIEPKPEQMCIYLHALSYEGKDWKFMTALPEWAKINHPAIPDN